MKKGVNVLSIKFVFTILMLSGAIHSIAQPLSANAGSNTSICLGSSLTIGGSPSASFGSPPYTYSWSPATGLSSSTVANPVASPTATTTYTLTVTDAVAATASAAIIVNVLPIPNAIATPSTQTICSGTGPAIVLSSGVGGTSFSWTVSQSGVTGGSSSSGSVVNQILTTSGASAGTATYTITPTASGCVGTPTTAVVTVNPNPAITSSGTVTVCSGTTINHPFTSNIPSTYTWSATDNANTTGESTTSQSSGTLNNTIVSTAPTSTNVSYTVQATSLAGCPGAFYPVTVTVNSLPVANTTPSSQTICSGSATNITANSTIAGTTYAWTVSQSGVTGGSSYSFPNLAQTLTTTGAVPGTATYTVTPTAAGCAGTPATVAVTVNPMPTVSVNSQTICSGGSATLTATPSLSGGTYSWSPGGSTSSTINVSPASTTSYTATYTRLGCSNIGTGTVTVNPNPSPSAGPDQNICAGSAVTFSASAGGGTTYSWTFGEGGTSTVLSPTYTYVTAGTYTATITSTSATGCTGTDNVTITVFDNPTVNNTVTNTTCFGACDGTITAAATGGSGPYVYSWIPGGQTTSLITGLCAGTYTVNVIDVNGCTALQTSTVNQPSSLSLSLFRTNETCFGACDGTATVSASGGVAPYVYDWDPGTPTGDFTTNITGLCAGNYTVNVTDANGCYTMASTNVGSPAALIAIAGTPQTICLGDSASLNGGASGGSAPYTFNWNDGTNNYTTQSITTAPVTGTSYTFTVTDIIGCTAVDYTSVSVIPAASISGQITYSGGSLITGVNTAVLYPTSSFDTVMVSSVDASGYYYFSSVMQGDYLIKVFADTTVHPSLIPTYYGNVFLWDSATVITHACSITTANIMMNESVAMSGPGTISGTIVEGNGFERIPGDPIPGVDVKLGRNPGGQLITSTQTGTGSSAGEYSFTGIPINNPGEYYTIYVDIPGLDRDSTYSVVVTSTSTNFPGLDYVADSTSIYIANEVATGNSNELIVRNNRLTIYPNPSSSIVNIEYTLESDGEVLIGVYNSIGVKLVDLISGNQLTGMHKYTLDIEKYLKLYPGIYFVYLSANNSSSVQRLVISK